MTEQVLFFNVFCKKDPHLNAGEKGMALVLIYFGRPPLGNTIKTNFITSQIADLQIGPILIFYKRV